MRASANAGPTDGAVQVTVEQGLAALSAADASPLTVRRYPTVVRDFIAWYAGAYGEPLTFAQFVPTVVIA